MLSMNKIRSNGGLTFSLSKLAVRYSKDSEWHMAMSGQGKPGPRLWRLNIW